MPHIGRNNQIGADGCRHLQALTELTSLTISSYNNIGTEGCHHLAAMAELAALRIHPDKNNIDNEDEVKKHLLAAKPNLELTIADKSLYWDPRFAF